MEKNLSSVSNGKTNGWKKENSITFKKLSLTVFVSAFVFMMGLAPGKSFGASLTIGSPTTVIGASNVCASSTKVQIHAFKITGASSGGTVTGVSFVTAGTYTASDIVKFELYYSPTDNFNTASLIGTVSTPTAAGTQTFTSFTSQNIGSNTTGYFWITMTVSSSVIDGHTITVAGTSPSNITSNPTTTSSAPASGTKTLGKATITLTSGSASPTVCMSSLMTSTVYTIGGSGTGASITSGSLPASVTGVFNGSTFTISGTPSATGNFPYTVTTSGSSCANPSASGSITVNPLPTAVTVSGAGTFCGSATLTASNNSNGTIYYQGTTSNGTSITTPSTTQSVTSSGTYYFRAQSAAGCWGTQGSAAVTINAAPAITSQSSTAQSVCQNNPSTALSVVATGTGLTYQWYQNTTASNTGGTAITSATAATYTPATSDAGTFYYYCIISGTCTPAATSNVSGAVTINALPADVTVSGSGTFCGSGTLTASNGGDGTIYFEGTTSNGTSTASPSSSQIVTASGTYYFRALSASGCWGNQGSATVTINNTSAPAGSTPQPFCAQTNPTVADLKATGTAIQWYDVSTGGTALATSTPLTDGTHYYASQTISGCESTTRLNVTVTFTNPPAAPAGNSTQPFCAINNPIVANLTATGSNIQWYAAASGGTALATSTPLVDGSHYYASQTFGCESTDRLDVTVTITNPAAPTGNASQAFCASINPTVANLAASGNSIQWYSVPSGGTALSSSTALVSGSHYYASQTVSGCQSSTRFDVTVTIHPLPTITTDASAKSVCYSSAAQATTLTYSGTTNNPTNYSISWNASPVNTFAPLTNAPLNGSPINIAVPAGTASGTYTGTISVQNANGCASAGKSFTVTVNGVPAATVGANKTICSGSSATIGTTAVSGSTYSWISSPAGFTSTSSNPIVSPTDTTTYTLSETVTATGCFNQNSIVITVTNLAVFNVTGRGLYCTGSTGNVIGLSGSETGVNYQLYKNSATTGPSIAGTGNTINFGIQTTGTYTVVATSGSGLCSKNMTGSITVSPNTPPTAVASAVPNTVCEIGNVQLQAYTDTTNGRMFDYSLSTTSYNYISPVSGIGTAITWTNGTDDGYASIPLPFPFKFFNQQYNVNNNLYVSTNGFISFTSLSSNNSNSAQKFPDPAASNNLIALAMSDLLVSTGSARYFTVGSAPDRIFVIEYNNFKFSRNNAQQPSAVSGQIQLFENKNIVEVHVSNINYHVNGNGLKVAYTLGIENANGSQGNSPTDRSISTVETSNAAYRWVPIASYSWSPSRFLNTSDVSNPLASGVNAATTYTVTITDFIGCSTTSGPLTINVNKKSQDPTSAAASMSAICSGGSVTLTLSGGGGGTGETIKWYSGSCSGTLAGTGNNLLVSPTETTIYYGRYENGSPCNSVSNCQSVTVTVNPVPVVNNTTTSSCSGSPFTVSPTSVPSGTTYSWTAPTYTGSVTEGHSNKNQTVISDSLTLTGTTPGTAAYTVTPTSGNCAGNTFTINITVNANMWNGITNDWNKASNWCSGVPTAATDVVIPAGVPNYPKLTAASAVRSLEIQSGAKVTLGGKTLSVYGNVSGAGEFLGSPASGLIFSGTNTSTLNFSKTIDTTTNALSTLTINSGTVTIGSNQLYVTDTLALNGGTFNTSGKLTLRSTSITNTARVAPVSGAINGEVTVERFIPAKRAFRFLSPAVTTTNGTKPTLKDNWMEGAVNPGVYDVSNPHPGFGTNITGPGSVASGLDPTIKNNSSLFTFDYTTQKWVAVINTYTTNLSPGEAYSLLVRGDRSIKMWTGNGDSINHLPYPTPTILRTTGKLFTGDHSTVLSSKAGDYTFIGNPYASPVNFKTMLGSSTNVTPSYYVFDPTLARRGAYVTYNTSNNQSNTPTSKVNENIQPGQAFFVQTKNGGSASINFKEGFKSTGNTAVFRDPNLLSKLSIQLLLGNNEAPGNSADGIVSFFGTNFSTGLSDDDSYKFTNEDENLAINRNGTSLSIEGRPMVTAEDTIPLKIWQFRQKNYYLKLAGSNFSPYLTAFVKDAYLSKETPVDLSSVTLFPFTIDSISASAAKDRFSIVFKPGSVLPVTLTSIKAYQKENNIQVDWTVEAETNIEGYEVERSADGQKFNKAATVAAKGNNAVAQIYNWLDDNPNTGSNYYRIKVIEKSGMIKYSNTVKVTIANVNSSITVFPNPIKGNVIQVRISNMKKGRYSAVLYNTLGQKLYGSIIEHTNRSGTYTISLGRLISKGIYTLHISKGDITVNERVIVE